ncbi:hypothetical protein BJ742DRAFT_768347 [Cladochytrium replicatum]|nr:hypothetical protein BJ742DRAFT_768347 [Cladochytrium replicatum]
MARYQLSILIAVLCWTSSLYASSIPPNVSAVVGSADSIEICATDNPNHCYPRVFQPSSEFAPILPGQEIPPGLHIRLNLQTGLKEAKFPDPSDRDEGGKVVIVNSEDRPSNENVGQTSSKPRSKLRGKETEDIEGFVLSSVDAPLETISEVLTKLEDIVHEVDWGTAFVQGEKGMTVILDYLQHESADIRLQASAVLGGAFSNNPAAVELAETSHHAGSRLRSALVSENNAKVLHRLVYAFASYSRASNLHGASFQKDMKMLLDVYKRAPENTQSRILDLVDDMFNPEMISEASKELLEKPFKVQTEEDLDGLLSRNEWEYGWCKILIDAGTAGVVVIERLRSVLDGFCQHS